MKLIKAFILSALILFSFQMEAQESAQVENTGLTRVTMMGGSKLEGKLISYDPETELVLEIIGSEVRLPSNRVKKIVMAASSKAVKVNRMRTNRLYHRTNIATLSNSNGTGMSLNYSMLYQQNKWLAAGLGIGVDNYYYQPGRNVYPLFLEVRSFLVDGNSSPYVSIKSGYGFIFNSENEGQSDTKGGMLINPTFGYRIGSSGLMMDLYLGFRFQSAEYESYNGWGLSHQDIQWNRVELGFGVSF